MNYKTLRGHWTVLFTMLLACVLCGVVALTAPALADEESKKETTEQTATEKKADEKTDADSDPIATLYGDVAKGEGADAADATVANLPEGAESMGNDVLWSNDKGDFVGGMVANDLIGCGETLNVKEAQVAGSIRLAARIINISSASVGESLTLAGQDINVTGGSSTVAALAGNTLTFASQTGDLYLAGREIIIDGVVNGDVHVYGDTLEIGPNAKIAGTLKGELGNDPKIDAAATIGANELKVEKAEAKEPADLFDWRIIAASAASCLLIALLIEWLAGGISEGAATLIKERPGSYLLWAILGIIVAPLVIVLMCVPIVTIPAAIACLLVLCAVALVSGGLVAAILAHLIAPKANRFVKAAIFGLLLGVGMAMPYAGIPLRGVAYALSLGYVLCATRKGIIERKERTAEEAIRF